MSIPSNLEATNIGVIVGEKIKYFDGTIYHFRVSVR